MLDQVIARSTFPDFLVISPPKTGSTWLADNLRCHPQIFIPAIKELKYFSALHWWADLDWYLEHFTSAGTRLKGEASPSYALLPVGQIRRIKSLMPRLKLVFMMREPIARAWSHARHHYRYRETNFGDRAGTIDDVTPEDWLDDFQHDCSVASGDYLGQLRRWLTVFPREQLFIAFFEDIQHGPEQLLRDLFAFLGVETALDLASFPITERILPGIDRDLSPELRARVHQLWHRRSVQLVDELQRRGVSVPPEWDRVLQPRGAEPSRPHPAFSRDLDDTFLTDILWREIESLSTWRLLVEGYNGYNILLDRGRLYALEQSLGERRLEGMSEEEFAVLQREGRCILGVNLADLKEQINVHLGRRCCLLA